MVSRLTDTIYSLIDFPGQKKCSFASYKTVMAFHYLFRKEVLYVDGYLSLQKKTNKHLLTSLSLHSRDACNYNVLSYCDR